VEALVADDAFASPVLDVGCGLGTESCFLACEGYDIVGVGVAPSAVERARGRDAFDARGGEDADGDWRVVECRDETFVSRGGEVPALLAVLERTA